MLRQIIYGIKNRKHMDKTRNDADTETGCETDGALKYEQITFRDSFDWGSMEVRLKVDQGVILEANAISEGADPELTKFIGLYLNGRKYERKEVLNILDLIPVNNEEENAVMRDVYQMFDAELDG
jgi:hypothetical protein